MSEPRQIVKVDKVRLTKNKPQKKTQNRLFDASIADGFLFMAIEDLESSMLLYHRGHYPQSIFLLQQSVEKAAKSLGIFLSLITDKDATKIVGHRPLNILKKTSSDMVRNLHAMNTELNVNPELKLFVSGMGLDVSAFDLKIDEVIEQAFAELKEMEVYDLDRKQIRSMVRDLKKRVDRNDVAIKKNREQGIREEDYARMKKALVDLVTSGLSATTLSPTKKKELVEDFQRNIISQFIPDKESTEYLITFLLVIGDCVTMLIPLAQLTAPHAIRSRYPIPDEGFDPIEYYTKVCPIVASLPDLYPFVRRTIEQIDLLYDLMAEDGDGAMATSYMENLLMDSQEKNA